MQIHDLQATFDEIKEAELAADASAAQTGAPESGAAAASGGDEDVEVEDVE